jgi:hypothetical protein
VQCLSVVDDPESSLESAVKQFDVDKEGILNRGSLVSILVSTFVMPVVLTALCLFAVGIKFFGPQPFDDMTREED